MDVLLIGTDGIHCKNLFAYTENNPVNGQDSSGAVVETVWDVVSLGVSVVDVCMNPTDLWAWGGLAGDVADCLIPCVGGIGEVVKGIRLAKMADTADDVKDGVKAVDNLHDAGKGIKVGKTLKKPNIVNFDSKQLGKKWGKHKTDYPDMKSYTDYQNYANDSFEIELKINGMNTDIELAATFWKIAMEKDADNMMI